LLALEGNESKCIHHVYGSLSQFLEGVSEYRVQVEQLLFERLLASLSLVFDYILLPHLKSFPFSEFGKKFQTLYLIVCFSFFQPMG
jgi:hypothetical protein